MEYSYICLSVYKSYYQINPAPFSDNFIIIRIKSVPKSVVGNQWKEE